MKRVFVEQIYSGTYQITVIDTETGDFLSYSEDKEMGFILSEYKDNLFSMGWRSVKDFLKNRIRHSSLKEIPYEERMSYEVERLLQWGAWLMYQRDHPKPGIRLKRADQVRALCLYMDRYGVSVSDAEAAMLERYKSGTYPQPPEKCRKILS